MALWSLVRIWRVGCIASNYIWSYDLWTRRCHEYCKTEAAGIRSDRVRISRRNRPHESDHRMRPNWSGNHTTFCRTYIYIYTCVYIYICIAFPEPFALTWPALSWSIFVSWYVFLPAKTCTNLASLPVPLMSLAPSRLWEKRQQDLEVQGLRVPRKWRVYDIWCGLARRNTWHVV